MKPIGQKIVKLLYDMNFDENPIILHVFSNGGAYLYQHIDLAIKEFQTPLHVSAYFRLFKYDCIHAVFFFSSDLWHNL